MRSPPSRGNRTPLPLPDRGDCVVFDLETNADRADLADHEIIEIGACRVVEGAVHGEFATLVRAERTLLPEIEQLTGIRAGDLKRASPLADAIAEFLEFVDDTPLIAHNGFGYDFLVLDEACRRLDVAPPAGVRLDSLELAHVVYPRAGALLPKNQDASVPPKGRRLEQLADHLGLDLGEHHRALADARLTVEVVRRLLDALDTAAPDRELQRYILREGGHPWAQFAKAAAVRPMLDDIVPAPEEWPPLEGSGTFDPQHGVAPLADGGTLMRGGRSHRPPQEEMARRVTGAFAGDRKLLVEAPTGTGKTFAYLIPAVAWARAAGAPVMVATHTKVLQNQVLSAIPEIEDALGPIRATLLKGRENYVSLEALEGALEEIAVNEALPLAVIAGWVASTPTGEWDDLRTWAIERGNSTFADLKWRLRVDYTPGPPLSRLDELCFYRRASDRVRDSHIAVLNHALLLSRTSRPGGSRWLVLDEAHNLEDSATAALSEEITENGLVRVLSGVWNGDRPNTLNRYRRATGAARDDPAVEAVRSAVESCSRAVEVFGKTLVSYIRKRTGPRREQVERFGTTYRLRRGLDTDRPGYRTVLKRAGSLSTELLRLAGALNDLTVPPDVRTPYRRHRLEQEIARVGRESREQARLVASIPRCEQHDEWIHIADLTIESDTWRWGLRRVPITVAPALRELWEDLDSFVLTSATLRVAGEWTYILERLGLEEAEVLDLPSPFTELCRQHLLVVPDYLPLPRGGLLDEFTRAEADEIARLFTLTSGRGLALFTARSRLAFTRDKARPLLDNRRIPLLAQGEQPAPALVERMRTDERASLLATRSFWEGIDIPGEALSLLVVEKLPFDSPDDPVVQARVEALETRGHDGFTDYVVPTAVLRLVQGIGRLIRTATDVGATVVLDKRLRKPVPYRETFLRSLPGPPRIERPADARKGYEAIARHLAIDLDDGLIAEIDAVPTSDPWRFIDELTLSEHEVTDHAVIGQRLDAVRNQFGFNTWRPGQLDVMKRILAGEDVLAVLPTGTGKSLAFQIPALLLPGVTLVISPLIALMRDQVRQLQGRGLTRAAALCAGMAQSEQEEILSGARSGRYKILYVSPERLWSKRFRDGLRLVAVARVVVDEAHCISQWGHSFRPEYAAIPDALDALTAKGRPPVAALTATATERVRLEISKLLRLRHVGAIVRSPDRPELHYWIERCENRLDRDLRVVQVLEAFRGQSAIVYVPRRQDCQRIAGLLLAAGHVAHAYHGGMEAPARTNAEEAFRYGEIDVVVATKAFGLGIDKPDIAVIVHLEMPASVEEYVQETGRAARGALTGTGPDVGHLVLLTMPRDCRIHDLFVRSAAPRLDDVESVWSVLAGADREHTLLAPDRLAGQAGLPAGAVEDGSLALAVHHLTGAGAVRRHEDVMWSGRVWIPSDVDLLLTDLERSDAELAKRSRTLVERVRGVGTEEYDAELWSRRLAMSPATLEERLLDLNRRDVLGLSAWRFAWQLERVAGCEPDWAAIEIRCDQRTGVVKHLSRRAQQYARRQDETCRRAYLLRYLGVDAPDRCHACDACRPDVQRPWADHAVTRESLAAALPARQAALTLLLDCRDRNFSKESYARTLAGDPRPKFSDWLREHPAFGRLSPLGLDGCRAVLDDLVQHGLAKYAARDYEGHQYETLVLTEEGRRRQ